MNLYRSDENIPFNKNTIIALGTFDGVHLGHLALLKRLNQISQQNKARGLIITFEPHPLMVIHSKKDMLRLLTTTEEKLIQFELNKIENVLLMPFTKELSKKNAPDFIKETLMNHIGLAGLIVGYNHTIGYHRKGNPELLQSLGEQLGFFMEHVPSVKVGNQIASSTNIRNALQYGNLELANQLLGRSYTIEGQVIRGKRIGRFLGFPTANIRVNPYKMVPKDGVYAVIVHYKGHCYQGIANIGFSPSIQGKSWGIEIYIDNFSEIIYNNTLKIEFIVRLRDEKRFKTTDALIHQIKMDKEKAHEMLIPFIRR